MNTISTDTVWCKAKRRKAHVCRDYVDHKVFAVRPNLNELRFLLSSHQLKDSTMNERDNVPAQ